MLYFFLWYFQQLKLHAFMFCFTIFPPFIFREAMSLPIKKFKPLTFHSCWANKVVFAVTLIYQIKYVAPNATCTIKLKSPYSCSISRSTSHLSHLLHMFAQSTLILLFFKFSCHIWIPNACVKNFWGNSSHFLMVHEYQPNNELYSEQWIF